MPLYFTRFSPKMQAEIAVVTLTQSMGLKRHCDSRCITPALRVIRGFPPMADDVRGVIAFYGA